jgi:hypothetical protein
MKKTMIAAAAVLIGASAMAQTDVNLKLHHQFDGVAFDYNSTYTTDNGVKVKFSRVQYYLSGMTLKHDGGQSLDISDTYVLGSANITDYPLGSHTFTSLEGIKFDLGVDYTNNHAGSNTFPSDHPLAYQSPLMDWGWPGGYFFFVIDGEYDEDGDGNFDGGFQMRGLGDQLLTSVTELAVTGSGSSIDLNIDVNIADWIMDIDMANAGFEHNAGAKNTAIAANTNDETVFTAGATTSLDENSTEIVNSIFVNYQLAYAPTLFYSINTKSNLTLTIVDMQGKVVLQKDGLQKDGNFFINKELNTGMYTAVFSNSEVKEVAKFTVTR